MNKFSHAKQRGLTLVELMISILLGLIVILAATALLISTKNTYTSQEQNSVVQDTGRFALENISRSLRQTAFENWDTGSGDTPQAPITNQPTMSATIFGADASRVTSTSEALSGLTTGDAVNGSDVVAVRFFGVGQTDGSMATDGYGSVIDCIGMPVAAPTSSDDAEDGRGWSIYYVANDTDEGVPELRCKYRAESGNWNSEAIARGVESFQVLYGVDTDTDTTADRIPNRYMTATQIDALDDNIVYEETGAVNQALEKNCKTNWKKVVDIQISLLVRGDNYTSSNTSGMTFHLFGENYSNENDAGTKIVVDELEEGVRKRVRKVFHTTVHNRNAIEGGGESECQI